VGDGLTVDGQSVQRRFEAGVARQAGPGRGDLQRLVAVLVVQIELDRPVARGRPPQPATFVVTVALLPQTVRALRRNVAMNWI